MSVTLILTAMPSESMLYQALCLMDQPEVTGVVLLYDGHYQVGMDLIQEKGLPFYRIIVGEDKPYFMALNEAVGLAKTPQVFFFDPYLTIEQVPLDRMLKQLSEGGLFAVGARESTVSFRTGLAVWPDEKGESWLSFESALVDRDLFLKLGGFDPVYQWGEGGDIALSVTARLAGYTWAISSDIVVERLAPSFWLTGLPKYEQDQLVMAQSFLLFWQVGPRVFSLLGLVHCFRLLATCFFFRPKQLRGGVRGFYWLVKRG